MRQARCSLRVVIPLGRAHRKSKKNSSSKTAFVLGIHLVSIGLAPMGPTTAKLRQQGRSSELSFRLARMEAATPSPLGERNSKRSVPPAQCPPGSRDLVGNFGRRFFHIASEPTTIDTTLSRVNQHRYYLPSQTRKLFRDPKPEPTART